MKKIFYIGLAGIFLFEILKVYFIMPMPGSQEMDSINLAYFLHTNRWVFRTLFVLMIVAGSMSAFRSRYKWIAVACMLLTVTVIYFFNFKMTADKMFLQPVNVVLKSQQENTLPGSRLVIGIENNGEAKAYPVEFLAYHHQVQDTVGGKKVMVTYCSVCRTGRVFEPVINGQNEKFRLVGMDHFNAMFEDATTKSWWRQTTGEAITGKMKGSKLTEIESRQMRIDKFFELYPNGYVMQTDEASDMNYDSLARFEQGKSKGRLTRTDSLSWKDKSWVIGVQVGSAYKAYDWNVLKKKRIINDVINQTPVVIALSDDEQSFVAFERPSAMNFTIRHDTLYADQTAYNFSGFSVSDLNDSLPPLKRIQSYQEFWHSWRTFHPGTLK